jgi:serine/threonine-protein kinase
VNAPEVPSAEAPGPDPLIGATIAGKFTIEELLGSGAMGRVFRARQLALDKPVAIKVMNSTLAVDPTFVARFAREAKAAARLDHPNSIRVFDFGREPDGLLYIVMELIAGKDLATEIEEVGRMPPDRIANILGQVLAALAVAHEMGVLHRDLKPANVMLLRRKNDDGQTVDFAKVCDFGIAKIMDSSSSAPTDERASTHPLTAGLVVGTPEYMAPEQARGANVDARADLYAVGVILFQMLTARLPFLGDTPLSMVIKHVTEAPPRPSSVCADIDPALEAICLKALQKNPSDRFQSASEMRHAIAAAAGGSVASAGPRPASVALAAPSASPTITTLPRSQASADGEDRSPDAAAAPEARPSPSRSRWIKVLVVTVAFGAGIALAARYRHPGKAALQPPPVAQLQTAAASAPATVPAVIASAPAESIAPSAMDPSVAKPLPSAPPVQVSAPSKPARGRAQSASAAPSRAAVAEAVAASPSPEEHAPAAESPVAVPTPPAPPPSVVAPVAPAVEQPPPASPAPAPPRFDVSSARVLVEPAARVSGTTSSAVNRAVSGAASQLTACYRAALPQLSGAVEGQATLHIETDGAGAITDARFGGPLGQSIQRCATPAVIGRRVANVDTGSASADIPLVFQPR